VIVALTGATGFVGTALLKLLIEYGHRVRALTRRSRTERDGIAWIDGALDDHAALAVLCSGADVAIHVAGVVNAPDAAGFDAGNRMGTVAMLGAAEAAGIVRFVHVSSLAAREPQLSMYGAAKRAGEDAVVASSLDWRVVRPPAVYGPGDTELLDMYRAARFGLLPLPPGGRTSVIHVDDLARFIVTLATQGETRAIYEIDDGVTGGWSHQEFANAIGDAVGRRVRTIALPRRLLALGAAIDGVVRGTSAKLTPDRVAYIAHPDWVADPALRPPIALWEPRIATAAGLRATAAWYREHGWL